ncbi:hypothetical protein ZIOFF_053847 [Zingiber officinale]|uniref:C3H1-type domain-containing protein n=1 Tax=Zingiber officinale TaxID=94328 RepID=A0A8J5KIX7_ZINOF|nr:hypothetical protein ZIOFF_053847 [Zingiber officinale]
MDYDAAAAGVHKRGARASSVSVTEASASTSPSRRPSMDEGVMELKLGVFGPRLVGRSGSDELDWEVAGFSSREATIRWKAYAFVASAEAMWQMSIREIDSMESGPYPERLGEPDCTYYLRTGLCRYGMTCRYNHPPNRQMAIATASIKGGYPERAGHPECQFYLRTGTCKFGATCKFHHPRDKAGIVGRVQLNVLGYPTRPNETECAYYMRTGVCKFGSTCKFHHPQPSNTLVSLRGSSVYPGVHSPTSQQSYSGGLTNWPLSRASFIASPRWQGLSSYAQVIVPQGLVQVPSWNTFPGQLGAVSSSESPLLMPRTSSFFGASRQSETVVGAQGTVPSYRSNALPMGQYIMARDSVFPERPDQPECQFYMKTGDCKFGAACKFNHPRERMVPPPNCLLSPLGLPLRPGEPLCIFYSRYGICKFGAHCKFNHPMATPMGLYAYSLSPSSPVDVPMARNFLVSSSGPPPLEVPLEATTGKSRRLSLSDSRQIASGNEGIQSEGSHHL